MTGFAEYEGWMCSRSWDGSIRVWKILPAGWTAVEPLRTLVPNGENNAIDSLSVLKDRLISGHCSGLLRAWNVATGGCDKVVDSTLRASVVQFRR